MAVPGALVVGGARHSWPLGGAADLVSAAFRSTILQEAASDELRGRLQGVFVVVVAVARGWPMRCTAVAAVVGTTATAAGGGALVVVGVLLSVLAAPAFIRYRAAQLVPDADGR